MEAGAESSAWVLASNPFEETVRKQFMTTMWVQNDPKGLGAKLGAMKRWRKWLARQPQWAHQSWCAPSPLCFGQALMEISVGGDTASSNFFEPDALVER